MASVGASVALFNPFRAPFSFCSNNFVVDSCCSTQRSDFSRCTWTRLQSAVEGCRVNWLQAVRCCRLWVTASRGPGCKQTADALWCHEIMIGLRDLCQCVVLCSTVALCEGQGRGRLAALSLSCVLTSGDGTSGREGAFTSR